MLIFSLSFIIVNVVMFAFFNFSVLYFCCLYVNIQLRYVHMYECSLCRLHWFSDSTCCSCNILYNSTIFRGCHVSIFFLLSIVMLDPTSVCAYVCIYVLSVSCSIASFFAFVKLKFIVFFPGSFSLLFPLFESDRKNWRRCERKSGQYRTNCLRWSYNCQSSN